jgi:type IV pilus assembly protein PilM
MAAPARITSLNLGTQTIGMAVFQKAENGGISLSAYRSTEILSDPSAESSRLPQTRLAVAEMKNELKLKEEPVNYAISAQNTFARFVKLPPVAEDKVESIIGFEAQQNVPFPIEEVVWDYQLVSSPTDGQTEVVLVAIKSDLLDDLNSAIEGAGFKTQVVDAAPMALYNAFRYNYSDLTDCSLICDLGARTTNLIFIETGRIFSRSIPIGGNTITANLAKEFGEGFSAAEERKKRDGYVSLGGAYADDQNPEVAREAKIIRNTMTRLHTDIARSISFYRAQQSGSAPQRIFLCGGTANLPYLREFFAEKFTIPIEYFNPLRNVAVTGSVDASAVARNAHMLGELVGLGLRGLSNCPMELNLRPLGVIRAQRIASRRPYLIMAGLCLLLALAGFWLYFLRAAAIQSAVLADLNSKVTTMRGYEDKFNRLAKETNELKARSAPLVQTVDDRQFWPRIISELNARLPEKNIWITLLEPRSGGKTLNLEDLNKPLVPVEANAVVLPGQKPTRPVVDSIHVKGLYFFNPNEDRVVTDFVKNLSQSPYFNLDKSEKIVVPLRTPQNDKEWAFEYELQLKLKQPMTLP